MGGTHEGGRRRGLFEHKTGCVELGERERWKTPHRERHIQSTAKKRRGGRRDIRHVPPEKNIRHYRVHDERRGVLPQSPPGSSSLASEETMTSFDEKPIESKPLPRRRIFLRVETHTLQRTPEPPLGRKRHICYIVCRVAIRIIRI